jgi:hypothetical protein
MGRKFLISVVVMFIMSVGLGFAVHGGLLGQDYAQLPHLYRPQQDMRSYFPLMLLAHLFIATAFAWIYLKGREDKPFLVQGIRYGAAIAVLSTIPVYLIYYALQPMPGAVVIKQIVFDTIGVILMGVALAWLNRKSR